MMRILVFVILSFCAVYPVRGQVVADLETTVNAYMVKNEIPGAAVAVANGESVLFAHGFGIADIQRQVLVTENTHFFLGSITKSFVALGIVKLAEEGKLGLEQPVRELLPDLPIVNPWRESNPVLVAHLLEHTSGMFEALTPVFNWEHEPQIPLEEALQILTDEIVIHHRPGDFYLYSNLGYLLAGIVIERVSGQKYEDYLEELILDPLGMATSTFKVNDPQTRSILARGHGSGGRPLEYTNLYVRSAGASHSSALEMARYVQFYLNRGEGPGGRILTSESMERLETPSTSLASRAGFGYGYGLGSENAFRGGFYWRGHNGAIFGYYSDFWYNCDLDLGFVVLVNQFDMASADRVRGLRNVVAEHLTRDLTPRVRDPISLSSSELGVHDGLYGVGYKGKDPLGLLNGILGITSVRSNRRGVSIKELFGSKEEYLPLSDELFRRTDLPGATVAFFSTPEGTAAMVKGQEYNEKKSAWLVIASLATLTWAVLALAAALLVGLAVIVDLLIRKIRQTRGMPAWVRVTIIPSSAAVILILGFFLLSTQSANLLGKRTAVNYLFFVSTWMFAALSIASLWGTFKCFKDPCSWVLKAYGTVVPITLTLLTVVLWRWGVIGLKLWM